MIRIFIVIVSAFIAGMQIAAHDWRLSLYWLLVCAYWVLNTLDWRNKHD